MTPHRLELESCAALTMALAHVHTARRHHFAASSDGLLLFLSEQFWGLVRLAGLLGDLLTERQAEQSEPILDLELKALLPF